MAATTLQPGYAPANPDVRPDAAARSNVGIEYVDALHSTVRDSAALVHALTNGELFVPAQFGSMTAFSEAMTLLFMLERRVEEGVRLIDAEMNRLIDRSQETAA